MPPTDIVMEPKESLRDHIFPLKPKLVVNHVHNTLVSLKIGPPNRSLQSVSLWLLKNVFWFAIYLVGSCLTIWLCLLLFNDYSRPDNILTRVTPNTVDGVPLPNITVCMPFDAILLFPLNSSSATPYSDAIEDFFNKTVENGKFDTTNYTMAWNNSREMVSTETLFILHKYLTIMYEAEYLRETMENPFNSSLWQAESDQDNALLSVLVPRIQQMNITTDEIKNVFIQYFQTGSTKCNGDFDDVLFCIYPTRSGDECDFFDAISYLDQNQICFKMHNIVRQVEGINLNFITVYIHDYSRATKMTGRKIIFNFNEDATPPNFAAASDESSIIEMKIGDWRKINIDYESVYHGLPVMSDGKLRCSYQTRLECEEKCRRALIKAMCGCTPVTLSTGQSDENKCTFAHYEKCLNYSGNEDKECRKSCPVNCNQTNYKISKSDTIKNRYTYATLTIMLNKYDYLIYEEYFKWTFTDFISAIGGALGIWLGLDFIVLIRFIFALVTKVFLKVSSLANLEVATSEDNQFDFNESVIKKVFTALNIEVPPRFTRISLIMWSLKYILWVIIYLAGGVLTAKSCFDLYEQYASGEMRTSMQVFFNRSISLPPITVCLFHNIQHYYSLYPRFASSTYYTDALGVYLNQTNISKDSILKYDVNDSSWPPVMVFLVYKYLIVLYYYENNNEYTPPDMYKHPINEWQKYLSEDSYKIKDWDDERCGNYSKDHNHTIEQWWNHPTPYEECQNYYVAEYVKDLQNAIEYVLIPKLTELNITVDELRQRTVYQINSDAKLTFRFFGSIQNTAIDNVRLACLNLQTYCVRISLENFTFKSEKENVEIALGNIKIIDEKNMKDPIFFKFDTTFPVPKLISDNSDTKFHETYFYMAFGKSKSISLLINYKIALEPDSQKCSNIKSVEEWDTPYRIKYIEEMCNCSPTSWPGLLPSTSRVCTWQEYKTCLIYNQSSWFYNNIWRSNTSTMPCEKIEMDYTENEIHDVETSMSNTLISRIRIRFEDLVYLTIEEEMKMTFVQFAVAFGGTLGIVLGLDFRFIAWLVFTPPFVLLSYLFKKLFHKKAYFFKSMRNTKLKIALNAKFVRLIASILDLNLSDILKLNKFTFIGKTFRNAYWLIYYTAGGILTFLLFRSVVTNYIRNNNAKVIFVPMNNESISLSSPTICLPFLPLKTDSDHEQNNVTLTNIVQNYLSNKAKMGLLEDEWNPAFINYMHFYLVQYGKYEWFFSDDFPNNMEHSALFDVLDNTINAIDIAFEELREKFGRKLARMYQLNVAFYANVSNETHESLNFRTVLVEETKICYKPLMKLLNFSSFSNFFKITANGTLMRRSDKWFDNLTPITIDLNGRNTNRKGATILDATVSGNFGENTTVALEIDTIIRAQPVVGGEMRCSNLLSLAQCRSSCSGTAIKNTCKCLPRTIKLTTSSNENAHFCTLTDYKQCSLSLQSDAFACLDGCLEPCDIIRFSAWSSITQPTLKRNAYVEVNLRIRSFKYQYMEEQLIYTGEEFIGETGGALGLFLGLSVLMYIEFFYALFIIFVTKKWAKIQPVPELDDNIVETSP